VSGRKSTPFHFLSFFIPAVLLVFACRNSFAQRVGFGPKIGPNVSLFRGDFPINGMQGVKLGFTGGGYINFRFKHAKQFQFQMELLYTQRGHTADFVNSLTDPINTPQEKLVYSLSYIEVPLLFKYMLNKSGMTRPYLFGGPTYSGILTAKLKDENRNKSLDIRESIKRDDFGFMLGWGISTFILDRWYHLDLRYFHGFLDLSESLTNVLRPYNPFYPEQIISSYRNSTLSITIGVGIEKRETFFLR
jgi:hypothetical protein